MVDMCCLADVLSTLPRVSTHDSCSMAFMVWYCDLVCCDVVYVVMWRSNMCCGVLWCGVAR